MTGQTPTQDNLTRLEVDELVILAQSEERAASRRALEELVRRHQKTVYVALYHLAPHRGDLQDLTQEVLLRMCRSIRSVRNPKTFKYWLNRIITNLFYDELRKQPRQLNTVSMDAPYFGDDEADNSTRDIPDGSAQPEHLVMGGELDEQIRKAIESLPEQFRTIVVLREIQGLSYEEIAELTDANLGTVKSRLARARSRLQEILKPYVQD